MAENGALAAPNGVWKWIAGILLAVMLAGAPSIIQAVKAPSQNEVNIIRDRQIQVLIRLSKIETQIAQLRAELLRHENSQR